MNFIHRGSATLTVIQLRDVLNAMLTRGYADKPVKMAIAGIDIGEIYTAHVRVVTGAGTCCLLEQA